MIEIAKWRGIEVVERKIKPEELSELPGGFLTGSAAEITPIGEIGEVRYTPAALSLGMAEDYGKLVRRQISLNATPQATSAAA